MPRRTKRLPASTLSKGIAVLECFGADRPVLGVSEAARLLQTDKGTASRLLRQLADAGLLEAGDGGYRLGWRIGELGAIWQHSFPLESAMPATVVALSRELAATVQYAAYNETLHKPVITFAVEGPRRLKVASEVGAVVPVHVTAVGYAIASVLDDEELQACLASCDWSPYAADTPIDARILAARLAEVRTRRWAVVEGEFFPEQCSIAAPVVDVGGVVHGALAVLLVPGSDSVEKERIGQAVWEMARRLGDKLPLSSALRRSVDRSTRKLSERKGV